MYKKKRILHYCMIFILCYLFIWKQMDSIVAINGLL